MLSLPTTPLRLFEALEELDKIEREAEQVKCKISANKVTLQATGITIDEGLKILESAKKVDPTAAVDVVIYHVVMEREIDEAVIGKKKI